MSNLMEILVTCDSNNPLWTCSVWDHVTGTTLMTYKGGGTAESKTLCFIGTDYIVTAERMKPLLYVWPINSHQTIQGMRFVLPGKASALAFTRHGNYCLAGIDEKIYLWQTASGNLLCIINRHYQKVVIIKFSEDGQYFVSAAEDGMVMVWSLAAVAAHPDVELVTQSSAGQQDPLYILSDHSLPVTDLCISQTGIQGRMCTVSADRTCKIYDLSSGEMLLNIVFDVPLTAVVFDVLELNVIVGTAEGNIHEISLTNPPRTRDMLVNDDKNLPNFISHTKAVTCLSVSLDGETLMSGSNDEQVIIWDIKSRQPIRFIKHKGPITNAYFSINIPAMFRQDFTPNIILHSFDRTLEKEEDDVTEIEILINKQIDFWPHNEEFQKDGDNITDDSKVMEYSLSEREKRLKKEIEDLKKINANLYKISVEDALQTVVSPSTNTSTTSISKKKKKKNKTKTKF